MLTALEYLQSFNNAALAALTPEQLQMAVDIAYLEVDSCTYGPYREIAAANLAAHNLLVESGSSSATGGGQSVVEKRVGKRFERYSGYNAGSVVSRPDGLDGTEYGKRFLHYVNMVTVRVSNTGLGRFGCR